MMAVRLLLPVGEGFETAGNLFHGPRIDSESLNMSIAIDKNDVRPVSAVVSGFRRIATASGTY